MRKIGVFRSKYKFKITTVLTTILVAVALISSSSLSLKISNISKTENIDIEINEGELPKPIKLSAGLAPNVDVKNHNIPTEVVPFDEYMWGYIVNSSVYNEGPCTFAVDYPGDIEYLKDTESYDFLSGGTGSSDERWLAVEYGNGNLWEISPEDGDMICIGGGGASLNGLAWNPVNQHMFGASGSKLYMVDPETGDQEYIGSFGNDVNEMIGIAVNTNGVMYGWDLGDKLWTIDMETGEATEVGPLGIDLNYAQDGEFCHYSGYLYLTAYTVSPNVGSYLYECNVETGECTMIGQFEGNSQITASFKSFGMPPLPTDIGIKNIISPNDGDAGEEIEIAVTVKNYGYHSEDDVPVNVVILKDGIFEEYNETEYINISYGETIDVEMPSWTPDAWQNESNEYIDYKITACVYVYNDANKTNDCKEKWFELYFGYFHDVGCTDVIGPESGPAQTFQVNATIKNFGQNDECCFKTEVEIAEVDLSSSEEVFSYDFPSCTPWPPVGWSSTDSHFRCYDSSYAGGTAPELWFYYYPELYPHTFRFSSPSIDTSDFDAVEIEFKQRILHGSGNYKIQIQTSEDGNTWDTVWSTYGKTGPHTVTLFTGENVGVDTFYIAFVVQTYGSHFLYWFVDDIIIKGYTTFDPEYEDFKCTTTIYPGEEKGLEMDDWTPDYLQYETTDTKIYLLKAWTDMLSPADENLDNDLFTEIIILDYFHDVSIKEITSPPPGPGYSRRFYAVECNDYTGECKFIWFNPKDPGTFNVISNWPSYGFPHGATFDKDGYMWLCDSDGYLYIKEDPDSDEIETIGNSGTDGLVGLAFHEHTGILYGMSTKKLYEIDMYSGSATLIGSMDNSGIMVSLDCDRDGIMYAYELGITTGWTYTIDLDTGKATKLGPTNVSMNNGQDMAFDWNTKTMYACVFNFEKYRSELHWVDLDTGKFNYIGTMKNGAQVTCLAIPGVSSSHMSYVPLGVESIVAIAENVGTFPEEDMNCYAEMYEYITNCTSGTLVYEDNITDIDIPEPLGGEETLTFDDYNFAHEGGYLLKLNLTDDDDDDLSNNYYYWEIGCDGTPPTSSHILDPPYPDGENGWYVGDIEVTICAIDPNIGCGFSGSGIKEIVVRINGGPWETYSYDCITIIIDEEGDGVFVEYYSIDNVGNEEPIKSFTIKRDSTSPDLVANWEVIRKNQKYYIKFTCEATDSLSGMNRVEMYIDDVLYETIEGPGPIYVFEIKWSSEYKNSKFKFIAHDMAGNSDFKELEDVKNKSFTISKSTTPKSSKIQPIKTSKQISNMFTVLR
jgi:hypothetical protein